MRVVVQRVSEASVSVDGSRVASIGQGLCLLVGVATDDGPAEAQALVNKVVGLRVFSDADGKMNLSVGDVGGEVLVVSQFTLFGDVRKGRRPSFTGAADPAHAAPLLDQVVGLLGDRGVPTQTGVFGAKMELALVNDGPVTLSFDVKRGSVV